MKRVAALILIASRFILVQSRGISERRLWVHRKLRYAEDDVAIFHQYLVVFEDFASSDNLLDYVREWMDGEFGESEVVLEYGTIFKGLVMTNVPQYNLQNIVEDDRVAYVTEVSLAVS
jgi:hypothetical protein